MHDTAKEDDKSPRGNTHSIDSDRDHDEDVKSGKEKRKGKRPANTAFRQQRLKAWQPILTPSTVIPLFFIIGVLFTPVGGLLFWNNDKIDQISIDYTRCAKEAPTAPSWADIPGDRVSSHFKKSDYGLGTPAAWQQENVTIDYHGVGLETTICSLQFDVLSEMKPPVLFYYQLTNFFQNHRRYVKSLDYDQLKGQARPANTLTDDCDPVRIDDETKKPIYPCGLIANSLFNDTFSSPVLMNTQNSSSDSMKYSMTKIGIAWSSDAKMFGKTAYRIGDAVPPPNWRHRYPHGYTNQTGYPDLHTDEPFQVWMRTAGLPAFSKLAMQNRTMSMQPGRYQVDIRDYFPASDYGGTKRILITTKTFMGARNNFLSISYLAAGGLCMVAGLMFVVLNCVKPRRLGDHTNLVFSADRGS